MTKKIITAVALVASVFSVDIAKADLPGGMFQCVGDHVTRCDTKEECSTTATDFTVFEFASYSKKYKRCTHSSPSAKRKCKGFSGTRTEGTEGYMRLLIISNERLGTLLRVKYRLLPPGRAVNVTFTHTYKQGGFTYTMNGICRHYSASE